MRVVVGPWRLPGSNLGSSPAVGQRSLIDGTPTAGEVQLHTSTWYTEMRELALLDTGKSLARFQDLQEIDKASHHQDITPPWLLELKPLLQPKLCSYTNTSICKKNLVYVW